jgi:hypothetical protein
MRFGAMAAPQAWLLIAAAAAIAVWLFRLKIRPPRVSVPSLLLWTRVLSESREQTIWERIRRAVSLVVTAAVAVALAVAFTRPAREARADVAAGSSVSSRVLVVIDSSWSMLAQTRSGETRWQRAIAEARRIAAGSAGVDVAVATTADGLVQGPTLDGTLIETALDRIAPAGGSGAAWPRLAGADVHFVTDGAIARPLDRAVVVHSVYEAAANAGITAFEVRRALDGADDEGYVEVANFGPPQQVRLTVVRGAASVVDRRIDMGAGESLHQVLRLPHGGASDLRARVDASHDALDDDNRAFAWIPPTIAVTIVGDDTSWLAPWSAANPDVRATFTNLAGYQPGREDVVIFDRCAPAAAPGKPALYLAPPATAGLGSPTGQTEQRPVWTSVGPHPVLDGVDALTLSVDRIRVYKTSLQPLAQSSQAAPLVAVREAAPRAVLLAFGPADSNLPSAPAFPVLMGNAIEWLARPAAGGSRRAGTSSFDPAVVRVDGPQGDPAVLLRFPGEAVALLGRPGLYTAEAAGVRSTFAVNIADPDVSNLSRTTIDATRPSLAVAAGLTPRPWWIYLVALAFMAAAIEWWTWLRRITV